MKNQNRPDHGNRNSWCSPSHWPDKGTFWSPISHRDALTGCADDAVFSCCSGWSLVHGVEIGAGVYQSGLAHLRYCLHCPSSALDHPPVPTQPAPTLERRWWSCLEGIPHWRSWMHGKQILIAKARVALRVALLPYFHDWSMWRKCMWTGCAWEGWPHAGWGVGLFPETWAAGAFIWRFPNCGPCTVDGLPGHG